MMQAHPAAAAPIAAPIDLPILAVMPALMAALASGPNAVLEAPPGAGKTTLVPLALLEAAWRGDGKIIVLEPRRLAAKTAAARMAALCGEPLGQRVGYRVRLDSCVSPATRIEVVTQGVFLRHIQADPALEGVAAIVFDEFHERSLEADLALAFTLQSQAVFRPALRLLAMSATLDGQAAAGILGAAPVIVSEGRLFPIETRWLEPPAHESKERWMAKVIRRALQEETGDILAFLPGGPEIRRVWRHLEEGEGGLEGHIDLVALYGDLPLAAQDAALRAAPAGRRKVTLATSIAETSLTIEGVRVTIDSGLARQARFDPRSGMGRLETAPVSRAQADQRRGRAGRLSPGVCYRLWSKAEDRALIPFADPEITRADLAPLALEMAQWGVRDAAELSFLTPPPRPALEEARRLLERLGALDPTWNITAHGRAMAGLGLHPRLAHMILKGKEMGLLRLACRLAALLAERDPLRTERAGADVRLRLQAMDDRKGGTADQTLIRSILEAARALERQAGGQAGEMDLDQAGILLALAYPDRIGRKREASNGQFRLSGGRGASLDPSDPLATADCLVACALDGQGRDARIFLATPVSADALRTHFAAHLQTQIDVRWDAQQEAVRARRRQQLFEIALRDETIADPPGDAVIAAMIEGVRRLGIAALPWNKSLQQWRDRLRFLRASAPEQWPDVSDAALSEDLEHWLAPYLAGLTRRAHLDRLDLAPALHGLLSWEQRRVMDEEAPSHIVAPTGNAIPIDYSGEEPTMAVRLQELFGLSETPKLGRQRIPVLLRLLSPAHRPVQVTRDLAGFWSGSYREVKKDLAGRYPRHYWPDNPLEAEPTARAKRRGS
jgi:ATP-dependent helicase HrpB